MPYTSQEAETIALCQALIRSNSLSGAEGDTAHLVAEKMHELRFDRVVIDPFGSVIGWKQGRRPGPVVLFDAHMDVVPVSEPERWTRPPYSGQLEDGCIWGRGASDMKGPLAAALLALGGLPAEEISGTVVFSASVGEEKHEGAALEQVMRQVQPDFVVICEPNGCCLGLGQKGRAGLQVTIEGKPAHSSVPHLGENAVYKGMQVIERLRQMELPAHEFVGPGVLELIDAVSSPYPSRSTVPSGFALRYDRRLIPGETVESVLASMRQALTGLPGWQVSFEQVTFACYTGETLSALDFHPAWSTPPDSPWVQRAAAALQAAGIEKQISAARFCTNGSYSAGVAGVSTLIFGPSSGLLAHCIDEHIRVDELLQGLAGYQALGTTLGRA